MYDRAWLAFGGNWAAWQPNQINAPVVSLKTHGPPVAEIGLLGSGIKCACGEIEVA